MFFCLNGGNSEEHFAASAGEFLYSIGMEILDEFTFYFGS